MSNKSTMSILVLGFLHCTFSSKTSLVFTIVRKKWLGLQHSNNHASRVNAASISKFSDFTSFYPLNHSHQFTHYTSNSTSHISQPEVLTDNHKSYQQGDDGQHVSFYQHPGITSLNHQEITISSQPWNPLDHSACIFKMNNECYILYGFVSHLVETPFVHDDQGRENVSFFPVEYKSFISTLLTVNKNFVTWLISSLH